MCHIYVETILSDFFSLIFSHLLEQSLTESGAHQLPSLTGQQAPGTHLALSPQHWGCRYAKLCLPSIFLGVFWGSEHKFLTLA